jgi:hypothetical protein
VAAEDVDGLPDYLGGDDGGDRFDESVSRGRLPRDRGRGSRRSRHLASAAPEAQAVAAWRQRTGIGPEALLGKLYAALRGVVTLLGLFVVGGIAYAGTSNGWVGLAVGLLLSCLLWLGGQYFG